MLVSLLALTVLGCDAFTDEGDAPVDTSVGVGDCPAGMVAADAADLQFDDLQVDGRGVFVVFDGLTYGADGQPPACVNYAGTQAEYILSVDGEPQGKLSVGVLSTGDYDLASDNASLRIELTDVVADPAVDESAWEVNSTMNVVSFGDVLQWTAYNALSTGTSGAVVYVEVYGSATTP